jgi:S1-C subfamily serine protease
MHRPTRTATAALFGAALIGAGTGAGIYSAADSGQRAVTVPVAATAQPAASKQTGLSASQIYDADQAGVVEITVTTGGSGNLSPFGPNQGASQAQGSGFVYDTAGHIVTNEHVVAGADSIDVKFQNGSTYKASLVGSDASTDLAVLKVDAPQSILKPLQLADSNDVQVGDGAVAIGSPFGLENSVTSGIVSALHRQITAPNDFAIEDAIQTDAAINHGNSGGPLLDLLGRVIGVTSQIKSEGGGNEGVGFAIPSNTVHTVAGQLISNGKIEHAYLGVTVATIPSDAAGALGVPAGVEITQVRAGTPAEHAGLHGATGTKIVTGESYPTGGDVIIRVDGKQVTSSDELRSLIDAKHPGDQITLTVVRAGSQRTVQVTLATRPS